MCEFCNEQFKSLAADLMDAVENIKDKFNAHTCKREDVKLDMAKRPRDPNQLAKPAKSDLYKKTISN